MNDNDEIKFTLPNSSNEVAEVSAAEIEVIEDGYRRIFSRESPEYFIDKGGAGAVYHLPGGFCIKIFFDRHDSPYSEHMDLGNTPIKEASLQERMSHSSFSGNVRVPKYLGTFEKNGVIQKNALVMETLDAHNLQLLLNNKNLPDNFNTDTFLASLEKFIQHMHAEDRIVHNDLFPRNIMVDKATGDPRVIDFGRSVDTTYLVENSIKLEIEERDWKLFDKICEEIYSLQK